MKKLFAILLTLAMVLSLAACGGGDEDKTPSSSNTPPSSSQQEQQPSNTPNPDPGTSEPEETPSTPDDGQAQQTADEYVAALSEYVKNRHSNALIYYDDTYMLGDWGYPVLVACEQSESDENACIAYLYMGHFNQDTAYDKSKTAESVGANGEVDASIVIEWNDELKCYSYPYGNSSGSNSWADMESKASSGTVIQERAQ